MAVYNQQLWTEGVTAVTATPSVSLGTRRSVAGKEYVYCYNAGTVVDKCLIVKPSANNDTGYSFTVTTVVDTLMPVIGVVSEQTCAAASYCWVQTTGKAKGILGGNSTMSVGGAVVTARIRQADDGDIDIATGGTGSTGLAIGYLTTAISDVTGTSVSIYINTGY